MTYTITFNANDGSENPSTVTQNFTAGIAQALIPVEELGFSKAGFSFAGWGRAPKSKQASYVDGASYTATANETLYALWSEIPIYSVNIPVNANGSVTANPATATAGTEITLSNAPNEGYQFTSYSVTDADGTAVAVTDGKFTMPAKNVTVTALFTALTYTITFNANDGSPNPTTATQTFTAGTPQNLKTIAELGFAKEGFNFAGWLTAADATDATYADGASYTGTAAATLWASWSEVPVYSANVKANERGTVRATPATGTAGTEVTLSAAPKAGYELASYTVTAADGTYVKVENGKFKMPAQNVTVSATFTAINYSVNVGTIVGGSVSANPVTATVGTEITLSNTPNAGYKFASYTVRDADGAAVVVADGKFTMPAKNVTVSATFSAISYNINVGTFANGSVEAAPSAATVGETVTLTVSTASGYGLETLTVTADGGASVKVDGTGDSRTFTMPAKNVTVTATFSAINYSINVGTIANGSVTASPTTATVGTKITLSSTPNEGYKFASYTVTDADGGTVAVTNGKFTMPAKNVTVSATFSAISYNINVGNFANGSVEATPSAATVGTRVTLTASPASGYGLASLTVTDESGASVLLDGTGNTRTFTMPAKNVTVVKAKFAAIYSIKVGAFAYGSVTASEKTAMVGTSVTLTASPVYGCELTTLYVAKEGGLYVNVEGTGNTRTFKMPEENVIVKARFSVLPSSYMTLGSWPQTIKAATVDVSDQCESKTVGDFTYYKGSDGEWYAKIKEDGCSGVYSDGTAVGQGGTSEQWFKVEPIKWRVLTADYNGTGKKLLFAENILIAKRYNDRPSFSTIVNNYKNSEIRKWLNSNVNGYYSNSNHCYYYDAVSDYSDSGGFLKTAFTDAELAKIAATSVVNNARSTNPDDDATRWNKGNNKYASDTPTNDKVFLLSVQEATKNAYGFDACTAYKGDGTHDESTRIRQATDYAKASGAAGHWILRSPYFDDEVVVRYVGNQGAAGAYSTTSVTTKTVGVVPALCLSN